MHLVAVFVENQPGQTARVTQALSEARIDIRWVTIASNGSFGVLKFLVDKPDLAVESLQRKGFMVSMLEVLLVEVPNQPGSLHAVAACLSQNQLNLDNCSGFVANNRAILLIELRDIAQAQTVLAKAGWRLLSQEDLSAL